ncbi:MAG: hypothetical protein PHO62_07590 [Sulfurimonas sp.]|nr:hypothetical protein [Sulfurimonas sp.]MDD5373268.1 hypothetical protein [Sulfurimonas sp.]
MKKISIKMNKKQKKISELLTMVWFIIFLVFGEIQYSRGNYKEIISSKG